MADILMENPGVINAERLDAELRTALGDAYTGLSGGRDGLRLHMTAAATNPEQAIARAIVAAHDPSLLTDAQQQQIDREATFAALQAAVEAMDLSQPLSAGDAEKLTRYTFLRGLLGR